MRFTRHRHHRAVDSFRARKARPHEVGEGVLGLLSIPDEAVCAPGIPGGRRRDQVAAIRAPGGAAGDLVSRSVRCRGGSGAGNTGRSPQVPDVLRAARTEAGTGRTGAHPMTGMTGPAAARFVSYSASIWWARARKPGLCATVDGACSAMASSFSRTRSNCFRGPGDRASRHRHCGRSWRSPQSGRGGDVDWWPRPGERRKTGHFVRRLLRGKAA